MKTAPITAETDSEIATLKDRVVELEALVKFYEGQFRLAKHRQFGTSSEKSEYDQLEVFNEAEVSADANIPEPTIAEAQRSYRRRKSLPNEKLSAELPVETVEHTLPEEERACPECGGDMHAMGRERRRELVIIPAQVKIREHVKHVYACRNCERDECGTPIRKAPVDEPVIKGSFASPEAIAHIMTQKFVMGTPLYRQEQDWNRHGIPLSRQTMSNWLIKATEDYLVPIYDVMREMLLLREVLHADETTLQVLQEPGKTAQSKSYMWLYRTGGDAMFPIVLYEYQSDRRAKWPKEFLKGFKGYLHTDGYDAYHDLPGEIVVVGCFAHARRKFDEALKSLPEKDRPNSNAWRGKCFCDKLFEFERDFAKMTPQDRFKARLEKSKPILDEFFAWANSLNTVPKTPLGIAVGYTLSQRVYLERFLLDGRLEISNNRAERSIKPFVIGRKNFLFANTPRGAKASAVMFSIIETAKENGLNPNAYLTHVFQNAPNYDLRDHNYLDLIMPHSAPPACKIIKI